MLSLSEECHSVLNDQTRIIVECCLRYFNRPDRAHQARVLLQVFHREAPFSLRLIDWLVTNYSRNHRIVLRREDGIFDLHDDYHRHLTVYNKRFFDPFARRQRIHLHHPEHGTLMTTVGQINFMMWFLENGLDRIITEEKDTIDRDMRQLILQRRRGAKKENHKDGVIENESSQNDNPKRTNKKKKKMTTTVVIEPRCYGGPFYLTF